MQKLFLSIDLDGRKEYRKLTLTRLIMDGNDAKKQEKSKTNIEKDQFSIYQY